MPDRVLFVCHSRAIGGSELYLEEIARRMADRAEVRVVCRPDGVLDEWAARLEAAGPTVARLDPRRPEGWRRLLAAVRWASVVHLTLANRVGAYQVATTLACRVGRRPLVCTHQLARATEDLPLGWLGRRFRAAALRGVYGYASRNIAVSEEGRRLLTARAGLDARRTVRIGNGVDVERFAPVPCDARRALRRRLLDDRPDDRPICCTVARLSAQKGLDVLVEAAAILRRRQGRPPARFVVVGDGELREPLERRIHERGVEDAVELLGARPPDEVAGWLAAADVFVLPSRYEGLSLAVMEAMACGLPVVVSDVSGSAELVPTAEDGRVVPADDPAALADAGEELLADAGLRRHMGERARTRAERHSWEECFARTAAVLDEAARRA